jgi:transglutaminase-like putative cysteine protease
MALWSGLIAKPQRTPLTSRPSLTLYFLLAGAFLLTLVPHVLQFPPWLTAVIVTAMVLRSVIEIYRLPLPSSTFCGILAVILFGLTWIQFGTVIGRSAGTAVTAGLLAIKFYEIRAPRDIALIIFSCFFVVMSALLFSQVLELFAYCLIMMWILTALLMRVQAGDRPEDMLLHMLVKSGLVFLQALPLALLLFFFFPRIYGPLGFTLSEPPIGLTDRVAPGSIAKLSQDDTPAMYVHFKSPNIPLPEAMYWRVVVLYEYAQGVFSTGDVAELPAPPHPGKQAPKSGEEIGQEITIRANNQRWLYALDIPVRKPANDAENSTWGDLYNGDTIRLTANKLDHIARYTVYSSPLRPQETISQEEYNATGQLPNAKDGPIDPRVVQLADQLYQTAGGKEDNYIEEVKKYFHQQGFVYSTNLSPQAADWLPQFLLETKTGYCEHFASAFAILMRQKGFHARLVAGYLGGDYNPYTDDYTVSQSNAHAWDEVWMPTDPAFPLTGRYTRIDPTAAAASSEEAARMDASPDEGSALRVQLRTPTFADTFFPAWLKVGVREMRLRREQMETGWDNVVLSYDTDTQFRLAELLGFGVNPKFKLLLVCIGAAAVCALACWRWLARKPAISPVEFLYAAFCRTMARRGIPRAAWEGPLAYTERVAEAFPDETPALHDIGALVARARYGPAPVGVDTTAQLENALARITAAQAATIVRDKN